jgi:hypothetical protein
MDPWRIVELLVLGIVGLVSAVMRSTLDDHSKRIGQIESTIYTRAEADRGRAELKSELKSDIAALRAEITEQHNRIFDRLDTIVDRLPAKGA